MKVKPLKCATFVLKLYTNTQEYDILPGLELYELNTGISISALDHIPARIYSFKFGNRNSRKRFGIFLLSECWPKQNLQKTGNLKILDLKSKFRKKGLYVQVKIFSVP